MLIVPGHMYTLSMGGLFASVKSRRATLLCLFVSLVVILTVFLKKHSLSNDASSELQSVPEIKHVTRAGLGSQKVNIITYELNNVFGQKDKKGRFSAISDDTVFPIKFELEAKAFASGASFAKTVEDISPKLRGKFKKAEVGKYIAHYWENRSDGKPVDIEKFIACIEIDGYRKPLLEAGHASNAKEFVLLLEEVDVPSHDEVGDAR